MKPKETGETCFTGAGRKNNAAYQQRCSKALVQSSDAFVSTNRIERVCNASIVNAIGLKVLNQESQQANPQTSKQCRAKNASFKSRGFSTTRFKGKTIY